MKSRALGQNFLRNRRTARRLVHLAGAPLDALCVDLGAGNGMITEAALMRSGTIRAIELDTRLAQDLRQRFRDQPRVLVECADIRTAPPPDEPFVIAANPPFNASTEIVRRWLLDRHFISGAIIVERAFARRVQGEYGATKLSLSLAPFLELTTAAKVNSAEFSPQPATTTVILTARRVDTPALTGAEPERYWAFVNYLFERSRLTVGEALSPLRVPRLSRALRDTAVRQLQSSEALSLFAQAISEDDVRWKAVVEFNRTLPSRRRPDLASLTS